MIAMVEYYYFLKIISAYSQKKKILFISVPCIKQELEDAVFDAKIEPNVNPLPIVDGINGPLFAKKEHHIPDRNGSIEEIYIKEEPPQDVVVS